MIIAKSIYITIVSENIRFIYSKGISIIDTEKTACSLYNINNVSN